MTLPPIFLLLRRSLAMQRLGYGLFACFALLVSLYWTFPADALAQRLAREVQRSSLGTWSLTFVEASTYGLTGLRLEQVVLTRSQSGTESAQLHINRAQVRLRLLPLLLAQLSADFSAYLGDGLLTVRLTPLGSVGLDLNVQLTAIDLAAPPLLATLLGLPIGGLVDGHMELHWPSDLKLASGELALTGRTISAGPETVQGFSVPLLNLGDLNLNLSLKDGRAQVANFSQQGGNISLQMSASSQLRLPLPLSPMDACLQFRVDQGFLNSNPKMRSVMQLAELQLRRDPAGFLHVPLGGFIGTPQFRPGLCR